MRSPSPARAALLCLCFAAALHFGCGGCVARVSGGGSDAGADAGPGAPDTGPGDVGTVQLDAGPPIPCAYIAQSGGAVPGVAWEHVGPPGGYASAVLALGQGVVLAGTGFTTGLAGISGNGGGLYRSTDGAKTFNQLLTFHNTTVSSLVEAPGTSSVFAGVGSLSGSADDGVWLSTDLGVNFSQQVDAGMISPARVRVVSVAAGTPLRVYALVEGNAANPLAAVTSLYRLDSGGPWVLMAATGLNPAAGGPALAMAADLADPNRVYLADAAAFYVSTDGGASFTATPFGALFPPAGLAEVNGLFTDPADPNHLFLTTLDVGLFESTNRGASWAPTAVNMVGVNAVAAAAGRVFAATEGLGLLVGTNGNYVATSTCPMLPVTRAVSVAPDDAGSVFVGTVGGAVLRSSDGAQTFLPQQSGIPEMLAKVAVTRGGDGWALASAGLFRTTDLGSHWTRVAPAGQILPWSDIVGDPLDANRFLLTTDEDLFEGAAAGQGVLSFSLNDGGLTRATGLDGGSFAAVTFDPTNPSRVFAYERLSVNEANNGDTFPTGVFVSIDGGTAFSPTAMQGASLDLTSTFRESPLAIASDGTVYAGVYPMPSGPAALWSSSDQGQHYTQIWSADGGVVSGVFLDGHDALYLTLRFNGGLLKSVDRGATFNAFGNGLDGGALSIDGLAFSPDGGVVLATEGGVFYASDGVNFSDFNTGFTTVPIVWNVVVLPGPPVTVFAGTDQGIFRRLLP
jgi:hypothetical protein